MMLFYLSKSFATYSHSK
uniref:Uncharacterized protein n=1 Tax=Arundo donax TaxID=35708 RepID=A0A0A9BWE1_ARUDO